MGVAFAIGAVARVVGPFVAVSVEGTTLFRICAALFAATVWLQLRAATGLDLPPPLPGHGAKRVSLFDKRLPASPQPLSPHVSWAITPDDRPSTELSLDRN